MLAVTLEEVVPVLTALILSLMSDRLSVEAMFTSFPEIRISPDKSSDVAVSE